MVIHATTGMAPVAQEAGGPHPTPLFQILMSGWLGCPASMLFSGTQLSCRLKENTKS